MSIEKIKIVSDQILNRLQSVRGKGEGATRQALVVPMLEALGYDIWNPDEVCLEYDADFAIKKAGQKEKVDVAVFLNKIPRIYIEVKPIDEKLDGHEGQLARYFNSTTSVALGILTNGVEWRFFTDIGDQNVMDIQPFHIARIDSIDQGLEVLLKFSKALFNAESILAYATELLYTAKIANFLRQEFDLKDKDPSDYFIRWILKSEKMYDGIVNSNTLDTFKPIIKAALTRVIREIVRRSISAMESEAAQDDTKIEQIQVNSSVIDTVKQIQEKANIITTEQELQAFDMIKELFDRSPLASSTIYDSAQKKEVPIILSYKDTVTYFGIYLNKPSWWAIRLVVEAKKKLIGFNIDENVGKQYIPDEMLQLEPSGLANLRVEINQLSDIAKLSNLILATFQKTINDRKLQI